MSRREAGRAGAGGAAPGAAAGAGPRDEGVRALEKAASRGRREPSGFARSTSRGRRASTQQIRNYADAGVLPPAPRSPAGYRRFDDRHRQALLTYRALVRGHGPGTARAVMRAVHEGDVPRAFALIDAGHAALHEQRLSLRATGQALEAVAEGGPGAPALPRSRLHVGEVAAHLGVRTSALRVWESAGLLTPAREPGTSYRVYLPADVRDARVVHLLRQSHYLFAQIRPVLDDLRRQRRRRGAPDGPGPAGDRAERTDAGDAGGRGPSARLPRHRVARPVRLPRHRVGRPARPPRVLVAGSVQRGLRT